MLLETRQNVLTEDDLAEKALCEKGLRYYIKRAWPVIEPARAYQENWSIEAICDHLQAVSSHQIMRLLINVPPGAMKSLTTEVLWPTYEWGPCNMPNLKMISFSYSPDLTMRDNRKARILIASPWYQKLWGNRFQISDDQDAKGKFENNHLGFKLATSVGGVGTGERGDRVIVDDPHNVMGTDSDAKRTETIRWFRETLPTRVNDPNSTPIVVIMQRIHAQDVSGFILAEELGYDHLMLPMEFEPQRMCYSRIKPSYIPNAKPERVKYSQKDRCFLPDAEGTEFRYACDPRTEENELLWPQRYDRETVERDKKVLGSYAVAGQLQQRPAPRGGGMFKEDWFEVVDAVPADLMRDVRGWDLAASKEAKSPYTTGVRMGRAKNGVIYVMHCARKKGSPREVETMIKNIASQDGKRTKISIPQDPGQAGKVQKVYLASLLVGYNVRFSPETGSKEMRAEAFAAQAEAGNVKIIRGDWNRAYFDELCLFPNSVFMDQVDASSRAFHALIQKEEVLPAAPQEVTSHG